MSKSVLVVFLVFCQCSLLYSQRIQFFSEWHVKYDIKISNEIGSGDLYFANGKTFFTAKYKSNGISTTNIAESHSGDNDVEIKIYKNIFDNSDHYVYTDLNNEVTYSSYKGLNDGLKYVLKSNISSNEWKLTGKRNIISDHLCVEAILKTEKGVFHGWFMLTDNIVVGPFDTGITPGIAVIIVSDNFEVKMTSFERAKVSVVQEIENVVTIDKFENDRNQFLNSEIEALREKVKRIEARVNGR